MNNEIRLHRRIFLRLLDSWGGMNRDLMASAANMQRHRNSSPLPFYLQYYEEKAIGTDIFAQNIARAKGDKYPDVCFPPFSMIGLFLKHISESKGWCVIILSEHKASWSHLLKAARNLRRKLLVSLENENKCLDLNPTKWNLLEANSKCMPLN